MIEQIDLKTCFNVTHIPRLWERFMPDDELVYDPAAYEPIIYRCHSCDYLVSFKDDDFIKHRKSRFSNLKKNDDSIFNSYIVENELSFDSFLDFYCPKCKIATRVFFSDGFGGKCGDYIVNIDFALINTEIPPDARRLRFWLWA